MTKIFTTGIVALVSRHRTFKIEAKFVHALNVCGQKVNCMSSFMDQDPC